MLIAILIVSHPDPVPQSCIAQVFVKAITTNYCIDVNIDSITDSFTKICFVRFTRHTILRNCMSPEHCY